MRTVAERATLIATILLSIAAFPSRGRCGDLGTWVDLPSMTTPRQEVGAALLAGKIYVVGGLLDGFPFTATSEVEAFDLANNRWDPVPALPVPRDHMGVAVLDGRLYVIGGFDADFQPKSEVFIYEPGAPGWLVGPALPSPRGAQWAVSHLGKIYMFGGDGPGGTTRSTLVFSPTTGWTSGANMPTAREHLNAVVVGPFIHVIGGRNGPSTRAHERYDPANDRWVTRAPLPTARSAMFLAAQGNKIYAAGGETPQLFAVHEVYDVLTNTWTCAPDMPIPRHGIAAVPVFDRIVAPGGGIVQGLDPTNRVDAFVPDAIALQLKSSPDPPVAGSPYTLSLDVKNPSAVASVTIKLLYLVNGVPVRRLSLPSQTFPAGCFSDVVLASINRFPAVAPGVLVMLLVDDSDGSILTLASLELRSQ